MADRSQRTEKPTGKKKREARRQGQVARSPDVVPWLTTLAATFVAGPVIRAAQTRLADLVQQCARVIAHPDQASDLQILGAGFRDFAVVVAPVLGAALVLGVVGTGAQVGLGLSPGALRPKFSRVNPLSGLRRVLSPAGGWELAKQTLKLAAVGWVAVRAVENLVSTLAGGRSLSLEVAAGAGAAAALSLVRTTAGVGLVLALADWAYQRHRLAANLKMTKQEVKDENRQAEGDPMVKGQIRSRMRKLSRLRMMAAVAQADVVVANPVHYAVALVYDRSGGGAPRVVARGAGAVALRIKEEAATHGVPVVEDPPLARAIYAACQIDDEIPRVLYLAVARLLAFVYSLSTVQRGAPVTHRTDTGLLPEPSTALALGR